MTIAGWLLVLEPGQGGSVRAALRAFLVKDIRGHRLHEDRILYFSILL